MVFDIIAVVSLVLSSLCTLFLGSFAYGAYKTTKEQRRLLNRFKFGGFDDQK